MGISMLRKPTVLMHANAKDQNSLRGYCYQGRSLAFVRDRKVAGIISLDYLQRRLHYPKGL